MFLKENLKILREANNWTQEEVAKKVFISRSLYNKIETGVQQPRLQLLQALCILFQIDLNTLVNVKAENVHIIHMKHPLTDEQ